MCPGVAPLTFDSIPMYSKHVRRPINKMPSRGGLGAVLAPIPGPSRTQRGQKDTKKGWTGYPLKYGSRSNYL